MRAALPNAFLFGLTGTPVNKLDKNTFWAFGASEDSGGYLSRYTFQDSIRDEATLPLHFEPRLIDVHVDKSTLDEALNNLKELSFSANGYIDLFINFNNVVLPDPFGPSINVFSPIFRLRLIFESIFF